MANLPNHLQRSLSLSAMVFYGLDTIIGAALIANFMELSYAKLVGRFLKSAGEAIYVEKAIKYHVLFQS